MNDLDLYSSETSAVKSRHDFIEFLNNLLTDYQKTGKNWENQNLRDFLEALASYAADVDGYYQNLAKAGGEEIDADTASWRVFADMLRSATVYE
ncbi:hypothetical protein HHL22_01620 [Hymenobacter sp. RP-2-7]|uniref:DUF7660 domain-containing protein n=1 Tax=Hymenobacter polaris TaxID=2682546 RepID=A0A7Y0AAT1_9BACT|nr:hypothetical protein [Hymenobacter polaris]NML63893.1 hypothetical protein [Hymenobacter polaris]